MRVLGVLLTVGLMAVIGCAPSADYELLAAASAQEVYVTSDYPAVVLIALPTGGGICTGSFIAPRAVLTAAHCTQTEGTYRVYMSDGSHTTTTRHNLTSGAVGDPGDLALLVFDEDIADPSGGGILALGTAPQARQEVRLVGFGCNSLSTRRGAGFKRTGVNNISAVSDFLELLSTPSELVAASKGNFVLGPENQAGACFGDSGGPMLQVQNERTRLVGVTHAVGNRGQLIQSRFVNVNRADNLAFIQTVDDENDLGIFDGCWNEADAEACDPESASMGIFAFLKPLFAWLWSLLF